jgi:hypothetical protein
MLRRGGRAHTSALVCDPTLGETHAPVAPPLLARFPQELAKQLEQSGYAGVAA